MKNWILGCIASAILTAGLYAHQSGDAENGKDLFHQCSGCHNATSDVAKGGPSLKNLFKRSKLKNGKPVNEASVGAVIMAGGNGMPPFADQLSDQDKSDLIAYLKTL